MYCAYTYVHAYIFSVHVYLCVYFHTVLSLHMVYIADPGLHSSVHTSMYITSSRSQPKVQFWAGEHKVFSDVLSDSSVVVVDAVGNVNILETGYEELQRFVCLLFVFVYYFIGIPPYSQLPLLHILYSHSEFIHFHFQFIRLSSFPLQIPKGMATDGWNGRWTAIEGD